ncbi:MAG TPA: extracellular solute-binding protein [Gaiellaceae bacterium]|jgi:spermidine/putrescine-binding protein|nr:extracellular solute-binding protein [Gaiellaceae bacterium]
MTEHGDGTTRLSRGGLLKVAAAGGAGLVAARAGLAGAAPMRARAESGQLSVLDWAGYENDGGQPMFAAYVKKYPNNKPKFTYMTNEADALAKMQTGFRPDLFRPYVGWVKFFATSGLTQPWDPSLITNFKHLNPFMVKAGQYQGKQYGIPDDWGLDAILYRTDKVTPKSKSWGLLFDERYAGKIAWFDDIEMLEIAGLYLGFPNTWQQTDDQLKRSQELLMKKKHLARIIWSSETNLDEAFASGDIWIAYAWPNDWVQMRAKKLKVVYMHPREKPIAWVGMFMLIKGTSRPHLAHAYVDAWSSAKSGKWLEDNYGYGHANTLARPSSSDLLTALQLTNPRAVTLPNAYLDRDIPRRALYAKMWEEVKAS